APRPAAAAARAPAEAAPQASLCSRVEVAPAVRLTVGKSTVIKPLAPLVRLLLGNPENTRAATPTEGGGAKKEGDAGGQQAALDLRPGVAQVDVLLLGPSEVYLLGKTIGSTNIVMLDRSGTCTAFDVVVGMDTAALQASLTDLLPDEKGIRVSSAFDSVVLSGTVSDAEALVRATDVANAYVRSGSGGAAGNPRVIDMLSLGAPQQVMLEVKVAEVSKSLLDQFGIDFSRIYTASGGAMIRFLSGLIGGGAAVAGQIAGTGPTGVPLSSVGAVVGGSVSGGFGNSSTSSGVAAGNVTATYDPLTGRPTYTTTYGTVPGQGVTNVSLNMQKNDGVVKVLAEPTVMAVSGQTGSFLAGGKIFIPVASPNGSGGTSITLEEKTFGVSVRFTPTVLGGGRINLKVRPEVSELNAAGVTISGIGINTVLPSFSTRQAETTVQLMDGQSFAIGGLIKNNTTTNISAFPFLGELPVIGALFRSTSFQTDKSELVFLVTPHLVKPLPADYKLPTDNYTPPTRKELIYEGRVEGRPQAPPAPKESKP
ncbi:MAG: type II and III secretion system protein family protein, partial [Burkholderiales bacterium]|nr:type II and III secretion system protein family protein [Burkholderiales bacterium]